MNNFWGILLIFLQLWMGIRPTENTLKMVHVVMRHCERTPDEVELYPGSPYYNESIFAPYGYGQLTNKGKLNCYNVGKALRQRYLNFLDSAYHYSKVEGLSSSYERTKESLQLVLAGLFPPTKELVWSSELNWIPIATYYEEKATDMVVIPQATDWFQKELEKAEGTEEIKALRAPYQNFKEYIVQQIEQNITDQKLAYLSLGIELLDLLGHTIPEWMDSIHPNLTKKYLNDYSASLYVPWKLKRMGCGYLLRKIVHETEMKINGTSDKQIVIFSGHDLTVSSLLEVLDVWNKTQPALSSYCTLEVHNINGTFGFKLYIFNSSHNESYLIHIPGYGEFIPLDDLKIQKREFIYLDDLEETSHGVRNTVSTFIGVVFLFSIISRL